MERDQEETAVIFRVARDGEITAIFPCEPADCDGRLMTCYAHIGQHSGCSFEYARDGRSAKPAEYAGLAKELESIGYRLKVYKRVQRWMRDVFSAEVGRLRMLRRAV